MVPKEERTGKDLKPAGILPGNCPDGKYPEKKEKSMAIKQLKGQETLSNIIAEVSRVVVGKDEIKELLLVALLSRGHVLIEGTPGTAKTTTARTFAGTIGGVFKRVQGTPDMLPSDILGFYLYRTDGSSTFIPGPIFANVLLADELNRTTPRTQAALLQAMQEQQVTIERETFDLEQPFIVIASQIPFGGPGTSPFSDVQKDRFMLRIWSATSSMEEEDLILKNFDTISEPHIKAVTTPGDIIQLQEKVKEVYVADSIRHYILQIIDKLRHHQDIQAGLSTRAGIALLTGARALAFIHGREFVIPDDVKALLIPALSHRLQMTAEAEMADINPESVIKEVVTLVPVPKMSHE
jgi:MoxR-like ATPase